jgi:GDPmannose 4,6-dehydratase
MKALIFGISGQDGYYQSKLLQTINIEVLGVSRSQDDWIKGDVADFAFVENLIKTHLPDYIFHFAANSTTHHSALFDNHKAISTGTLNILECVRLHCPTARVFLSGSAMQFKNEGVPIDEQTPFEANSPYSVARIQSVYAGRYYRSAFGLKVYVGYFFNHDSPLRSEKHVNQKIVSSVKRIANGSTKMLELGNIDVKKEFNYAGDVVEAVWTLINQDTIFEAIIGSGEAHSIQEWVEYCFKKINRNWEDYVIINHAFTPEYKILVSNPGLIRSLGWQPKVDFYKLVDIMMETQ